MFTSMTPLHLLITALVRLLGLYFVVKSVESAAGPLFAMLMQISVLPDDPEVPLPNPWIVFLPMVAFYVLLAGVIFLFAPKISRMIIGRDSGSEAEVPWHETLIFCTGALIIAWAFVRSKDTVYRVVASAARSDGQYSFDNAMMIYLFLTAVLLGGGIVLVARFHRVSAWLSERRTTASKPE